MRKRRKKRRRVGLDTSSQYSPKPKPVESFNRGSSEEEVGWDSSSSSSDEEEDFADCSSAEREYLKRNAYEVKTGSLYEHRFGMGRREKEVKKTRSFGEEVPFQENGGSEDMISKKKFVFEDVKTPIKFGTPYKEVKVYKGDPTGKWYAVAVGKKVGVFTKWEECEPNVTGYSGNKHKCFKRLEDAENFVRKYRKDY